MARMKMISCRESAYVDFMSTKVGYPSYKTSGAAGFDFESAEDVTIKPGAVHPVRTGIRMEFPEHLELQVRPRSGLSIKFPNYIANSPGTIDADYRGEIMIIVVNNSTKDFVIKQHDRIAQGVFSPVVRCDIFISTQDLSKTERGSNGFGSTGT